MASTSMPNGKTLWAALSKSKMERLRAGHAGKTRVGYGCDLSSLPVPVRAPPRGAVVKQGKAPGMWVDVPHIARMLGTSGESLADRWEALIAE